MPAAPVKVVRMARDTLALRSRVSSCCVYLFLLCPVTTLQGEKRPAAAHVSLILTGNELEMERTLELNPLDVRSSPTGKRKRKKDAAHTKRAVVHRAIQQRFWPSVRCIRVRLGSVDTLVEVETVPPVATVQPPAAKETANKVC